MYIKFWKRVLDFLIAIPALILTAIPMLIFAIIIRFTSDGPIFYTQERFGKDCCRFKIYKFRSMRVDAPELPTDEIQGDYTYPFGEWMRQHSMDELPQIFNILKGDMAFVGPRPALHTQVTLIEGREKGNANSVRPGLTGLAQISGRDTLSEPEKIAYDIEYMHKISFWFDLCCLIKTFVPVVTKKGIVEGGKKVQKKSKVKAGKKGTKKSRKTVFAKK